MVLKFTIPGHPTPAVRMTQKGKFVDPAAKKYLDYKSQVAWVAKGAMTKAGLKTMMEGPIEVIAVAYIYGGKSGDADNLGKSFLDGMNGVVWKDDRQVTDLTVRKRSAAKKEEERVEIEVRQIGGGQHGNHTG